MTHKKIIIHHSATKDGATFSWSAIKRYHVQTLGWKTIGYHAGVELVDDDYFAMLGRDWDMTGAHTLGQNDWSLGLCFVGNYDDYEPDDEMLEVGAGVVKLWRRLYNIPLSEIHKHSEYAAKSCPGRLFPWVKFLSFCN
jgi:N-acetylmuramoyl-L-alanine amidase